jgi:hypothetical protein
MNPHRPRSVRGADAEDGRRSAWSDAGGETLDRGARPVRHRGIMTGDSGGISSPPGKASAADEFASLPLAREYIDAVQKQISSLAAPQLIDALARLHQAYREFPELEWERPRRALSEALRSAAKSAPDHAVIPLLIKIVPFDRSCRSAMTLLCEKIVELDDCRRLLPILRSATYSGKLPWHAIPPIINILYQPGSEAAPLEPVSEVLRFITEEETTAHLANVLAQLLGNELPAAIDSVALAKAARSGRHLPGHRAHGRNEPASRDVLLAMTARLGTTPSLQRTSLQPDLGWPSARLSFDEFLLQFPCEIELTVDQDDEAFIEEAYRAILLRAPAAAEVDQYLRLLHDGAVARPWVIENLLASEELRSLERRLRVKLGSYVITEPGRSEAAAMPAVTWPQRPVS